MYLELKPDANKKAAIVSMGMRITLFSNQVRSVDFKYARDYLQDVLKRPIVDFVSKPLKKEETLDYYKSIETTDLNEYDEVYIYNYNTNLFGGIFSHAAIQTFEKLLDYKGIIYYILVDPKLYLINQAEFIKSKYDKTGYIKTDSCEKYTGLNQTHFDKWNSQVQPNIKIAFGGSDYSLYKSLIYKKLENNKIKQQLDYDWSLFNIFEYQAANDKLDIKNNEYNNTREYGLVYQGNDRHNERNKIIKNLYSYNPDVKKLFIGFDPDIVNTDVKDYMCLDDMIKTMCNCYATVVLGDIAHNNNIRTPRFFETMTMDIVAFIYHEFDKDKKYIKNEFLREFCYIRTAEELDRKLKQIIEDKELFRKIINLQKKEIQEQFYKYNIKYINEHSLENVHPTI